jgi:hypothetical protein
VTGSTLSALTSLSMPTCIRCGHRGRDHNWRVPRCVKPGCDCYREHPRRLWGSCTVPGCWCTHYLPDPSTRTRVRSRLLRRGR